MNEKKILAALIAGVLLIIIILGLVGNCNPPVIDNSAATLIAAQAAAANRQYDSVAAHNKQLQRQYDSLIRVTADKRIATQPQLHNALQLVTTRTTKIKDNFDSGFWGTDNSKAILYNQIDSLNNEVTNLNGVVQHYEGLTDSLVRYYDERHNAINVQAQQKEQLYYQLRQNFIALADVQNSSAKNLKQLNRQLRAQKTKSHILLGAAAAAVTYAIIKQ